MRISLHQFITLSSFFFLMQYHIAFQHSIYRCRLYCHFLFRLVYYFFLSEFIRNILHKKQQVIQFLITIVRRAIKISEINFITSWCWCIFFLQSLFRNKSISTMKCRKLNQIFLRNFKNCDYIYFFSKLKKTVIK